MSKKCMSNVFFFFFFFLKPGAVVAGKRANAIVLRNARTPSRSIPPQEHRTSCRRRHKRSRCPGISK